MVSVTFPIKLSNRKYAISKFLDTHLQLGPLIDPTKNIENASFDPIKVY